MHKKEGELFIPSIEASDLDHPDYTSDVPVPPAEGQGVKTFVLGGNLYKSELSPSDVASRVGRIELRGVEPPSYSPFVASNGQYGEPDEHLCEMIEFSPEEYTVDDELDDLSDL